MGTDKPPSFCAFLLSFSMHGGTDMIEVKHVSKKYGSKYAVRDATFTVRKGEILGFACFLMSTLLSQRFFVWGEGKEHTKTASQMLRNENCAAGSI